MLYLLKSVGLRPRRLRYSCFLKSKCIPVLLYGLKICPLVKSQISSLDFAVNHFFMKLFNTSSI